MWKVAPLSKRHCIMVPIGCQHSKCQFWPTNKRLCCHIFPIRTALKPEGKIARLNYKDFYIASLHEILRLKYFSFLSAHDNCNHPLYLTSLMFYVSMYEFRHHFAIFIFFVWKNKYAILYFVVFICQGIRKFVYCEQYVQIGWE